MNKITPFLWFDSNAEQAVDFYLSVFKDSRRISEVRIPEGGPGPKGGVITIAYELNGQQFTAMNGGPSQHFDEAISFSISCEDQREIDYYWDALTADGGAPIQCGWLKDKFGLRWQVVPKNISDLIRSTAGMQAMMKMTKFDIAALEAANGS